MGARVRMRARMCLFSLISFFLSRSSHNGQCGVLHGDVRNTSFSRKSFCQRGRSRKTFSVKESSPCYNSIGVFKGAVQF